VLREGGHLLLRGGLKACRLLGQGSGRQRWEARGGGEQGVVVYAQLSNRSTRAHAQSGGARGQGMHMQRITTHTNNGNKSEQQ